MVLFFFVSTKGKFYTRCIGMRGTPLFASLQAGNVCVDSSWVKSTKIMCSYHALGLWLSLMRELYISVPYFGRQKDPGESNENRPTTSSKVEQDNQDDFFFRS